MRRIFLITAFLSALLSQSATAAGLLRENFESTRAAGMGNAYVALADDSNALWQNPAGLAFIQGTHVNLIDTTLSVDSLDTLIRLKNLIFSADAENFLRLDTQYQAFNFKPVFTTKYLGFSLYNNTFGFFDTKYLDILGFSIPSVDVYAFNDTALIAGFGVPVTNYFSFGASARLMMRTAIDANLSAQDLVAQLGLASIEDFESAIYTNLKSLAGNGYGIGLNIGTMLKLPLSGGKDAPMLQLAGVVEDELRPDHDRSGIHQGSGQHGTPGDAGRVGCVAESLPKGLGDTSYLGWSRLEFHPDTVKKNCPGICIWCHTSRSVSHSR